MTGLDTQLAQEILQMLRNARALAYRDAESFDQAATVLEHIGQILCGEVRVGLGRYEGEILGLAGQAPNTDARALRELFRTVREARNECVHSGDYIRHHVLRLVELFLILEEAVSMNGRYAGDLMVRQPLTAEPWHNVATVRRNMLTNSFSYVPVKTLNSKWELVSDRGLVTYLKGASNNERNLRLGATIQHLLTNSVINTESCHQFASDMPIATIKDALSTNDDAISQRPALIVNEGNLVGILTAFDLL